MNILVYVSYEILDNGVKIIAKTKLALKREVMGSRNMAQGYGAQLQQHLPWESGTNA